MADKLLGLTSADRFFGSSKLFFSYALGNSLFAGLKWAGGSAGAQSPFPSKPVHIFVPYAAGGGVDILARTLGDAVTVEGSTDGIRVEREHLDNVSIKLGTPDDPRLPLASFDRIFLIHMYHEVSEPYAFLWRLRPALRPGGKVIVVDVDRPTDAHGIPPGLLFCEFGAIGFRLTRFERKPELQGYYAQFEAAGDRPSPSEIKPCGGPAAAASRDRSRR